MFCFSTDSRRPSFVTRCFFVSSCGLLPPFVPPGGARSAVAFRAPPCALAALRGVGCMGQAPLKGGQRYFHFLYGCLPPLLTSGCSHPINQPPPFLTSGCGFQGIFFFIGYRFELRFVPIPQSLKPSCFIFGGWGRARKVQHPDYGGACRPYPPLIAVRCSYNLDAQREISHWSRASPVDA